VSITVHYFCSLLGRNDHNFRPLVVLLVAKAVNGQSGIYRAAPLSQGMPEWLGDKNMFRCSRRLIAAAHGGRAPQANGMHDRPFVGPALLQHGGRASLCVMSCTAGAG
jgi:hypothetical protein